MGAQESYLWGLVKIGPVAQEDLRVGQNLEVIGVNGPTVDPHPIHRPTRLAILKVKGKAGKLVFKF